MSGWGGGIVENDQRDTRETGSLNHRGHFENGGKGATVVIAQSAPVPAVCRGLAVKLIGQIRLVPPMPRHSVRQNMKPDCYDDATQFASSKNEESISTELSFIEMSVLVASDQAVFYCSRLPW